MKTFRFFGMALVAILLCANFISCSKDDSGNSGKSEKKLVKISIEGEDFYQFSYNNSGRLVKAINCYYLNELYNWKNESIDCSENGKYTGTYNLSYGLVTYYCRPDYPSGYYYNYYSYSIDGRISDGIVWDGDKLISMSGWSDYDVTYTYNGTTCKRGYYPLFVEGSLYMAHPEIFGMKTNQLPASEKGIISWDKTQTYSTTYDYEFDNEGYITKIKSTTEDGSSYTLVLTWQ
jgi:hypothetical protein